MKTALFLLLMSFSAFAQWDDAFSTRPNPRLLIEGNKCMGGERPVKGMRACRAGEWLVEVDHKNVCGPSSCTQKKVLPFIADLQLSDVITVPEYAFYEIIPKTKIDRRTHQILRDYWVRFDLNGVPEVLPRDEEL